MYWMYQVATDYLNLKESQPIFHCIPTTLIIDPQCNFLLFEASLNNNNKQPFSVKLLESSCLFLFFMEASSR